MKSLLQLIKEEIHDFVSDYWGDSSAEPTLADKVYFRNQGIETKPAETQVSGELIGYIKKQVDRPLREAVPVYKNPKNLNGYTSNTRGVLLTNGDFYVAKSFNALHDSILDLLAEKNIIPLASKFDYAEKYPKEFVAVQRIENSNTFGQSSAYDSFPNYYIEIFDNGEAKQPYGFSQY